MNSKAILSMLLLAALAGCGRTESRDAQPSQSDVVKPEYMKYDVGAYLVREFQLRDGTRCVVVHEAGITCEWHQPKVE